MSIIVWAVYERPRDYPEHVVVRAWHAKEDGKVEPELEPQLYPDLDTARDALQRQGLVRIGRLPGDDAAITETWM